MKPKTAVLVDGGFFLKRYASLYDGASAHSANTIAKNICKAAMGHISKDYELYRVYYYDCSPLDKRIHNPISKKSIDFSRTDIYKLRLELFEELKKKRKVALRLGRVKIPGTGRYIRRE